MDVSNTNSDLEKLLSDRPHSDDLIVVGIGASAGGVEALQEFFRNVPADSGMAYVVILHLSPDYDSKLAELLQSVAKISVSLVTQRTKVERNHVYVIPPNRHLMIIDGELAVAENMHVEDRRAPVDIFFRTLANSHGPRAVCVVLSGTGANGSMGLKRVKEMGGAAFVQNPKEAQFNEMPRNSIATELVDEILPVASIPEKIVAYKSRFGSISIPVEEEERPKDPKGALHQILSQIKISTGHDFTNYKRPTLLRRIERRINVRELPGLNEYASYLVQNPEETTALLKDLLISVTNFFRDKKAFDAIESEVLPGLIKAKTSKDQLRIWVAGCATGEEAYSLAILCAEQAMKLIDAPQIQIFATDIDEGAIRQGRDGLYSINDAADVSSERLRKFFNKEGEMYRIKREIREMILFANHNFIKDPPFSNLDLVACRNVLIYLNASAQERVLGTFHFALKSSAFLFLGSSESTDNANDLYSPYLREHHIFRKRHDASPRQYPVPEFIPKFLLEKSSLRSMEVSEQPAFRAQQRISFTELHQQLLEQYAPPSVIITADYNIVHLSERAGRYMHISGGELSHNLLKLVKPELRLELRAAIYQAVQQRSAVEARGLKVSVDDRMDTVNIHVRPSMNVVDGETGFLLVLFERVSEESSNNDIIISNNEPVARRLEEEIGMLKSKLRATNEGHDFHAEELKASNAELQAMNEELRSATEELETSKEELQSINEEIRTVNQELKVKIEELSLANNNLHNLIDSVDIGTIFLDRNLRVAFFTPCVRNIFNLIPSDFGRPLSDITGKLLYEKVIEDIESVLSRLQPITREVKTTDGRVYMMRVLPYRTGDDRINGVVLTFFDITERKKVEEDLRASEERLRLLIESAKDYAIFTIDPERRVNSWNTGAEAMMGYSHSEIVGQLGDILFVPEDREAGAPESEAHKALHEGYAENERWHHRKDGSRFYGSGMVRPLYNADDDLLGFVKIMRDLTEAKRAEEAQYFLASIVESTQDSIVTVNFESIITSWNKSAEKLYGYPAAEVIGKPLSVVTLPGDIKELFSHIDRIKDSKGVEIYDTISLNRRGKLINLEIVLSPVKSKDGDLIGVSTIARDVTHRIESEKALRASEERFRAIVSQTTAGVCLADLQGNITLVNAKLCDMLGYKENELLGLSVWNFTFSDDREKNKVLYEQLRSEGKPCEMDKRLVHKNGTLLWVNESLSVIRNKNEDAESTVAIILDITERKRLEEQREEFIAIASHELKTPVTSIKAYGEILLERFERSNMEKEIELMRRMDGQVNRLSLLIRDLLDTTKLTKGHFDLHKVEFDIKHLILERAEEIRRLSTRHELILDLAETSKVTADRERTGEVLTNLLTNAIKYSPDGGKVVICTKVDAGMFVVSISDEGIGVPHELQQRIFDRFYRVTNTQMATVQGMGLGLYISMGIIQRHGGSLSVKSELGRGSVFSFTIPHRPESKN
jgi:two-component system, chemotaxis family, CheB/CheR fusion protein